MPSLQNLATNFAAHWIRIIRARPSIANDRSLFKEGIDVTGGVNEFALYEPGKVVVYITDDLNFELHEKSNYKRTIYSARVVADRDTENNFLLSKRR